jgi:hypothetical protein
VETQLTQDVEGGGERWLYVQSVDGFRGGDWVYIERTGTNEEMVFLFEVDDVLNALRAYVTISHPADSYVTLRVEGYHIAERLAALINDPAETLPGRYGPSQAAIIEAEGGAGGPRTGPGDPIACYLRIRFRAGANYGKLGNLDRILATCGHEGDGELSGGWLERSVRFTGGDTDKKISRDARLHPAAPR